MITLLASSEIEIEGYDLFRVDKSPRGGGEGCHIEKILAYNYKHNFCKNTESIFIDIFLPKIKSILASILCRPSDQNDFVNNLEETFTGCIILEKQECYLFFSFDDFNINIFHNGENIFEKKSHKSKLKSFGYWVKGEMTECSATQKFKWSYFFHIR